MTLKETIQKFRNDDVESHQWPYLGCNCPNIHLDSEAEPGEVGFDEMSGGGTFPAEFLARGLHAPWTSAGRITVRKFGGIIAC